MTTAQHYSNQMKKLSSKIIVLVRMSEAYSSSSSYRCGVKAIT